MTDTLQKYFSSEGFFSETDSKPLSAESEKLRANVAAILIQAAKADGNFGPAEHEALGKMMEEKLGFAKGKIVSLLNTKLPLPALESTMQTMKSSLSAAEREQILTLVWSLIGADNAVAKKEGQFAVKLRTEMGLTMEQAFRARELAEGVTIDGFKEFVDTSPQVIAGTQEWVKKKGL